MIIVDFQQIMISNLMVHLTSKSFHEELDEDLVRHMILNSLRAINNKWKSEYAPMVIAYDSKNSWRKQIFPYYKANRKISQEKSVVDWHKLFEYLSRIKPELKEVLPYKVVEVDGCEADDVIGCLVRFKREHEKVIIISGDKDFVQLHNENVQQWDPVRKKFISSPDPQAFLWEHVVRGDVGDGIPNILSDDDTFVAGKRQSPMTHKRLEDLKSQSPVTGVAWRNPTPRNFFRNQRLIDLTQTPEEYTIKIMEHYATAIGGMRGRSSLMAYLMKNNCRYLLESIGDF